MDNNQSMDRKWEKRRVEVDRLLKKGSHAKLQRHQTTHALDVLKRAYDLAIQEPVLKRPLPQRAAYRYAHMLLRLDPASEADLTKIDDLFAEAAKAKSLNSLPCLYRLAVLDRLRRVSPVDETFVKERFQSCCQAVSEQLASNERDKFRLQHGLVNMLELAAYFLGVPLDALEGIGGNESGSPDDWYLVGPDPVIATVKFSREHALEELEARQETNMQASVFCLPAEGTPWWRQSPKTNCSGLRENTARLLAARLRAPNARPNQIVREALGEETSPANYRQALARFKGDLAQLTGRNRDDFLGTGPGSIGLPPDLVVYGAIAERRLRRVG